MRKFFAALSVVMLFSIVVAAQAFLSPRNISNDRDSMIPVVAADAVRGNVYVLTRGVDTQFGGTRGLRFMRSTDRGSTFSAPRAGLGDSLGSEQSMEVDSNGTIWIVWSQQTAIGVVRSSDGGETFSAVTWMPQENYESAPYVDRRNPDIAIDSLGVVTVVWQSRISSGNADIFFSRSTDGGQSFSAPAKVAATSAYSTEPRVAVGSGNSVHVVWNENALILYAKSIGGGAFTSPRTIATSSRRPRIAIDAAGILNVVAEPTYAMYTNFIRSTDNGNSFSTPKQITGMPPVHPDLATEPSGAIDVVAQPNGFTNPMLLSFARSTDGGTTFKVRTLADTVGNVIAGGVTTETGLARIAAADGIDVVWYDYTGGAFDTFYTKGVPGVPQGYLSAPSSFSLGRANVGGSTSYALIIKNPGDGDLTISGANTPTPFSAALGQTVLAPGQSAQMTLTFRPQVTGFVEQWLSIDSTSPDSPSYVRLSGTGLASTDTTPPQISFSLSGTLGRNNWYTTAVGLIWNVSDPESAVTSKTGCDPITLSADTAGQTVTCAATNAVNLSNSVSLTLKIDRTPPTVTYSGNAGTYGVDQVVNITCSATDNLSGVASTTCKNITGPAYAFNVGTNQFSANATDNAGNVGTGSASFDVLLNLAGLSRLTRQFVLSPGIANSLCSKLDAANRALARGNYQAKAGSLGAYANEVAAQAGKALTVEQANILLSLVARLQ